MTSTSQYELATYTGIGESFTMTLWAAPHTDTVGLVIENEADGQVTEGFDTELEGRTAFLQNIADDIAQAGE